jgi:DNA-binding NarL/FixJ family response regulator
MALSEERAMRELLYNVVKRDPAQSFEPVRIIVADDEARVRSALRLILSEDMGINIVAEVADIERLSSELERYHPQALLLDWELPAARAAGLVQRLRGVYPALKVVALSGRPEARTQSLAAGADAFVSKGDGADGLLAALRGLALLTAGRVQDKAGARGRGRKGGM